MVGRAVDVCEQFGMRLRMPGVDLEQMQRVGVLVPEELDVERGVIQTYLAYDPVADVAIRSVTRSGTAAGYWYRTKLGPSSWVTESTTPSVWVSPR